MIFKGSGVAMSTPFTDTGINYNTFEKMIEFQIENNTDALIVCGTTGEPSTMTKDEQNELIHFAVQKSNGRVPIVAGVGGNNTADVIACAKHAQDAGADALLAVTPYYNKCTNKGLVAHFEAVAESTSLPVILYNVPSRTGVNLCSAVFDKLCEHPNIAAIKEASGNICQITEMARVAQNRAALYSGNDDHVVPLLSVGGIGVISVVGNIMPKYMHDMVMAYLNGDTKKAAQMQLEIYPLALSMFLEVNPIPVKTALGLMGFDMGNLRLPLTEMEDENVEKMKAEMRRFHLID